MNRQDFEQQFTSISDQIWEFAEPRYQEFHSSALQADFLEKYLLFHIEHFYDRGYLCTNLIIMTL